MDCLPLEGMIKRDMNQLRNGDHVVVLKYVIGRTIPYWHHGFYSARLDKVVSYAVRPKKQGTEIMKGITGTFRRFTMDVANWGISALSGCEGRVVADEVSYFEYIQDQRRTGKVCVMPYGNSAIQVDGISDTPYLAELDQNRAVANAEWFVGEDHEYAFGKYNLRKWNCEHFVNYCSKTNSTPAELEREFDSGDSNELSHEFLTQHGRLRSVMSEVLVMHDLLQSGGDTDATQNAHFGTIDVELLN
ncbi:uncharacterized protein LOC135818230 [Sycon ciliatum]|uniref:uncharacterized protein LOC135818230 n=1 Tax=Sycon ciliatum TaxID=27933 RepID=UPI0020AD2B4A|eukprot:scpid84428/ scgid33530/ 